MAEAEEENKKINNSEEKINDTKKKSIKSSQQLKQLASDIGQAVSDTSKAQTSFQKSLGLSVGESLKLTNQLAKSATFSKNLNVSFAQTAKAVGLINSSLGVGTKLVAKQAEDIGRFALSLGLSEKSQANLAKRSIQTGKSVEGLVLSQIKVAKNAEAEFGTRLNIAEVIDKANQLSGQVRAQLGGNVEELTRAVSVAKELGFELESIAGSSKALLDFQSNIEAELEAELLTGRQLNLEQARLFALTGDYEGLTREIAANVGDFYEFSKLNVLQQDAIAKSVGMTSDQLSDQLFNQASITELKEKARDENDKETLARLEQLDIEKQFAQILLKVQSVFVSIASSSAVKGIFKGFEFMAQNADMLLGALLGAKTAMGVLAIRSAIIASNEAKTAFFSITGMSAKTLGVAAIAAAAGATAFYALRPPKEVNDLAIPPGGATHVTGPAGRFKLNSQDALVAGTDLGGNNNRRSDAEIVSLAARSIRVNLNTTELNSISTVIA